MDILLNDILKTGSRRNPIMLLMEAADDIAYNTADLEDMVKKGLLSFDKLDIDTTKYNIHEDGAKMYEFQAWLIDMRNNAIDYAAKQFIDYYQIIMEGNFEKEKEENGRTHKVKKSLTDGFFFGVDDSIRDKIYKERDEWIVKKYKAKDRTAKILDFLIQTSKKDSRTWTRTESEIMEGLKAFQYRVETDRLNLEESKKNKENKKKKENKTYFDYLAIVDYVSGMTDEYFIKVAKKIERATTVTGQKLEGKKR